VFAMLFWLTARRGATDPVCGMKVERAHALRAAVDGATYFFCSPHCRSAFEQDPRRYVTTREAGDRSTAAPLRAER
jgi:YHS domain-containing protein